MKNICRIFWRWWCWEGWPVPTRRFVFRQASDTQLSCEALRNELERVEQARGEIDSKTGFSGRNVGLALLFWPGIIVNESQASSAESQPLRVSTDLPNCIMSVAASKRTGSGEEGSEETRPLFARPLASSPQRSQIQVS